MSELPIVDAHHHVWDIGRNYHPWLRDEPMIPFRYGSYAPLRRNYLAADYRADSRRFDIRATVYVEAEWDPGDPIGETRWVHEIAAREGLPNAVVAQAWLDREDVAEVLAAAGRIPPRAQCPPQAACGAIGGRGAPGRAGIDGLRDLARGLCPSRAARPAFRPADALVAFRRRRQRWRATFRAR